MGSKPKASPSLEDSVIGASPSERTYSGSDSSLMDSRHLQQTWSLFTRGGIAKISTFIFGLYIFAVSMMAAGHEV